MNKTYRITISQQAQVNLVKILLYLETSWSKRVKDKFLKRFLDFIERIRHNPYLFPVSVYSNEVIKCMITKHNALFYRIVGNEVEIITIHDVRQNPEKLFFKTIEGD